MHLDAIQINASHMMMYLVQPWNDKLLHGRLVLAHLLDGTIEQVKDVVVSTGIIVRRHDGKLAHEPQ